jgi:hypothetical protein
VRTVFAVVNTDTVNRYGAAFTPGALASGLDEAWEIGAPMLIGHDFSRPIGWSSPIALHVEPGLSRLYAVMRVAENAEEGEQLRQRLRAFLGLKWQEHVDDFAALRAALSQHLHGDERHLHVECSSLHASGLARRAVPDAFARLDRDGLIDLSELVQIAPGVYRFGELALFAHRSFRRAHHPLNRLNAQFLEYIARLDRDRVQVQIALDPDMVGLAASYEEYFEYEYWWGPMFNDDVASIPPGVTRHQADERQRFFHGVSATEFWWQSRDGHHIFEAEELADWPVRLPGEEQYVGRYAHAMVSEADGRVVHFDGAVRAYDDAAMLHRVDATIATAGRHARYTKLWRLDGDIRVSEWKAALSNYFRGNPLVGEYLGASPEPKGETKDDVTPENGAASVHAPGWMPSGAGVRVVLSFHPIEPERQDGTSVVALDWVGSEAEKSPMVEWVTIELRKAVERLGGTLHLDAELRLIKYADCYVNLPLIAHTGSGAYAAMALTVDAIRSLAAGWAARGVDFAVSYAVEFEAGDRMVRVAAMGHVSDLAVWLGRPLAVPPGRLDAIRDWADDVASWLRRQRGAGGAPVRLDDTLMPTGVLRFRRPPVDTRTADVETSADEAGARFQVRIARHRQDLARAVEAAELRPAPVWAVHAARCCHCGGSYLACACSKVLDEDGAAVELTDVAFLGLVWTDRPDTHRLRYTA